MRKKNPHTTFTKGADTSDTLRERARDLLPPAIFDYVAQGAGDERTAAANRAGFGRYRLLPRVLTDTTTVKVAVEVLGTHLSAPLFTSPTSRVGYVHPDAESGIARAAAATGIGFILNAHSSVTMEDVAGSAGKSRWIQLYWQGNRHLMSDLARRAEAAGYEAVVLTVDNAVASRRPREVRNAFPTHADAALANYQRYAAPEWQGLVELDARGRPVKGSADDDTLTWRNVEWFRSTFSVPFLLKGIRSPDDGQLAAEIGADGVILSNHGGRALDGEPGTIELLEGMVGAVGGRVPILLDGGVRSARDVVIALGLGARAVGLGSTILWALACGGEATVAEFVEDLKQDIGRTLALIGVSDVEGLTRNHVSRRDEFLSDSALGPFLPPHARR